jgi:hypothetical protein
MTSTTARSRIGMAVAKIALPIAIALAPFSPTTNGLSVLKPAYAEPAKGEGDPAKKEKKKVVKQKGFTYTFGRCGESLKRDKRPMRLEASGSTVSFNHLLHTYCNADEGNALKVNYARKGRNLLVTEVFKANQLAKCTCDFEIEGTISGLAKGRYKITFVYEWRIYKDKPGSEVIETREFEIGAKPAATQPKKDDEPDGKLRKKPRSHEEEE